MAEFSEERTRLRAVAREARTALPPEVRQAASESIADHFLALPQVQQARVIAVYLSLPDEVSTVPLISRLRRLPAPPLLAAPVVLPGHRMAMYPLPRDLSGLQRGPFGVLQPPAAGCEPLAPGTLEVVVVPGVAFDRQGHRLGYGAGYYDRFLARLKSREADGRASRSASPPPVAHRPFLVGLAFAVQVLPAIPAAPHDLVVDLVVTEAGVQPALRA